MPTMAILCAFRSMLARCVRLRHLEWRDCVQHESDLAALLDICLNLRHVRTFHFSAGLISRGAVVPAVEDVKRLQCARAAPPPEQWSTVIETRLCELRRRQVKIQCF